MDIGPKGSVFLDRYLLLAQSPPPAGEGAPRTATIAELAQLWDCSARSARETLGRLQTWGLLAWDPRPGRARRSEVWLHVHPVHVYFERACRAEAAGSLAEAAFWLGEVLMSCPCIPDVPDRLDAVRARLRLEPAIAETLPCCADAAAIS